MQFNGESKIWKYFKAELEHIDICMEKINLNSYVTPYRKINS